MKISCLNYRRDLVAYVDGELPPDRASRIEQHLHACQECSLEVAGLRQVNGLAPPPLIEPSADFDRLFWTRLAREREQDSRPGFAERLVAARAFLLSPAGLSLSAGLAMAVFVTSLYMLRPDDPARLQRQQEIMAAADLDLYANLDVIQNSEALENFELIQALDEFEQDEQG